MLSKINETKKDKYHMISLICVIPKKKTNQNRLTDKKANWWL